MFPTQMKTGFAPTTNDDKIQDDLLLKVEALLITLLEKSIHVAAIYVNESKRNTITSTDMLYAIQYQAREFFKNENLIKNIDENYCKIKNGELEAGESESEDESEDGESEDELEDGELELEDESESEECPSDEDEPFVRCETSTDETVKLMNSYHDTWSTWMPTDRYECMLKKAIDEHFII